MIGNTIVAGNTGASSPDCSGTLTSTGFNWIQDTAGCTIVGDPTGNRIGGNPRLTPLADNGGPTQTQAPLSTSPVIDRGDPTGCHDEANALLLTDQAGSARVADGDANGVARCDIGAVEVPSCNVKPSAATLLKPADGAKVKTQHVTLGWSDATCARRYKVYIFDGSPTGNVVLVKTPLRNPTFTTPALTPGKTYFWRVRSCDKIGCTDSIPHSFKVRPTATP